MWIFYLIVSEVQEEKVWEEKVQEEVREEKVLEHELLAAIENVIVKECQG